MDDNVRLAYLFDFYGELLNAHQREIFERAVFDDLSFGEIAEEMDISRQAVHDTLSRVKKKLEGYEAKLGLVKKFMYIEGNIRAILALSEDERISRLGNEILEVL